MRLDSRPWGMRVVWLGAASAVALACSPSSSGGKGPGTDAGDAMTCDAGEGGGGSCGSSGDSSSGGGDSSSGDASSGDASSGDASTGDGSTGDGSTGGHGSCTVTFSGGPVGGSVTCPCKGNSFGLNVPSAGQAMSNGPNSFCPQGSPNNVSAIITLASPPQSGTTYTGGGAGVVSWDLGAQGAAGMANPCWGGPLSFIGSGGSLTFDVTTASGQPGNANHVAYVSGTATATIPCYAYNMSTHSFGPDGTSVQATFQFEACTASPCGT